MHLKYTNLINKIDEISNSNYKFNFENDDFNDITNTENFYKTELFQILIKINIFNKIRTFNHNLTDNVIDLIKKFNDKIYNLKFSFNQEKRNILNQNFSKLENEKCTIKIRTNLITSKLNESNNHLIYQNEFFQENKFFNLKKNSNLYNDSNLNVIQYDDSKIKSFPDSSIFQILESLIKESNNKNSLEYIRMIDEILNTYRYNEDILQKINECYKDFIDNLRFLFIENKKFDYIFIGERVIEDENYLKEDQSNCKDNISNSDGKELDSILLNDIYSEITENQENKNVYIQKIFIRLNEIDDSLEILLQNNKIIKKDDKQLEKNINKNKNFFNNVLLNSMMKICSEIKNPILNIIQSLREIKQKHYFEDKNDEIIIKNRDFYVKNIKYLAKSIDFVISDFELLGDIVTSHENPNEIINKFKNKIEKRKGIYDLIHEIEKIKKIFQFKIISSKKKILIMTSFENIPKKIKLEGSLFISFIFNILSNSLKFSNRGIITIKMNFNCSKKKLFIEISDQGIGLKKEKLNKLKNLFCKTDNHIENYQMEIGLFKVKMITEAFNGTIQIISEYGYGTNISIELPLIEDIINSANGNEEKIYKLALNTFDSNKYEEEKISYQNLLKNYENNLTENRNSYEIYPYQKNYSRCNLLSKNNKKIKDRFFIKENMEMKTDTFRENKTYDSKKNIRYSKRRSSKFLKFKTKISKKNISDDKQKDKVTSIDEKFSNNDDSNSNTKINNISIEKSSNEDNYNFSGIENKSTLRNSNIQDTFDVLPDSTNLLNDSKIMGNPGMIKEETLGNSANKNFAYNMRFDESNNSKSNIIYSKKTKNLKNFQDGIFYNKESVNSLHFFHKENTLNKEKMYKYSSFRNSNLNTENYNSTSIGKGYGLDKNKEDVNLNIGDKSIFCSENDKTNESVKIVETHLLDDSKDSNSLISNEDLRILVVDKEYLIRRSHINVIKKFSKKQKLNIVIEEASDGADCLHKIYLGFLDGIKYDLILTEESMNFMNGGFTSKIIKSLIKKNILENIKIIMITSYNINVIENLKSYKRIDHVYSKPLDEYTLRSIFSKCYDH